MKVTIMSLREFLGFSIKLPILEKSSIRRFMKCLEEHNVNRDNLPPLVEPEILVSYEVMD